MVDTAKILGCANTFDYCCVHIYISKSIYTIYIYCTYNSILTHFYSGMPKKSIYAVDLI